MELGKVPPHDVEAEQAVIGSMLTDKDSVISAVETLKDEDFYREDNKVIYGAIMNLYNRGEPVDIITLKDELVSLGKFEAVGGLEYLAELPEKVPTTANVDKYIKIVEEKSMLRTLIKTANELIVLGYDQTQEVEDIMDVAEKKIFNVMQRKNQKGYSSMKDILVESFTQLEELYNRKQHITGVPTGFADLDYKTAEHNNPVDIKRFTLLRSARKPLVSLPTAYTKKRQEPIIPSWVSVKTPSSTIGLRITFILKRQT